MKRYIPSNPIQKLLHNIFERDYSIQGILSNYFGIYQNCHTNKWGSFDEKKQEFVEYKLLIP